MKKTILVALIGLMVSTPCFAQEVEPEGVFSIEGTQWRPLYIGYDIGFYGGKVYCYSPRGWSQVPNSFYVNALVASFSIAISGASEDFIISTCVMQPLGIGVIINIGYSNTLPPFLFFQIGILHKISDNWTPPEEIIDISPDQGEQGAILTNVQFHGHNTTFQDNSPVEIFFDPPDGLTVSNIDVINNTTIEFDLEIAVDAAPVYRDMIVIYDKGRKVVENSDIVFRVMGLHPLGEIVSISPNQGEQGTTLTDVTIMGADTTFEDDGVSEILLMPPGGVDVSNINVISNAEIEFDLEIAVDAPVGSKIVIVEYGDGVLYLYNSEVVFEILEKTN